MSFQDFPPSLQNFVDSSDQPDSSEYEDSHSTSEIGMFGDFCLMCGEMIDGVGFDGSAYCSEECEYHQQISSDSSWCNLSVEGYELPSYGCSTAVSSAKTSPLNSPHLQPSGRLAILCSGPPHCESLLPLDLGESLLGAKAVAERYLENRPESFQDECENGDDKKHPEAETQEANWDPSQAILRSSRNLATITSTHNPLVPRNARLKSRPALAQLTDLNPHTGLPESFGSHSSGPALALVDLPPLGSKATLIHQSPIKTLSGSSRRVSEPVFRRTESISRSPSPSHGQLLYHSSFSLTSLSSLDYSSPPSDQFVEDRSTSFR